MPLYYSPHFLGEAARHGPALGKSPEYTTAVAATTTRSLHLAAAARSAAARVQEEHDMLKAIIWRFGKILICASTVALFLPADSIHGQESFAAGGQQPTPAVEEPVADANSTSDVKTASFQGVVPGETSLDEVKESLGEPLSVGADNNVTQLTYQVGPFPKIEITLVDRVVTSIVIHLSRPTAPAKIAGELGLSDFQPAPVPEPNGQMLGQAYPERGVLFVFTDNIELLEVSHIVLEPIAAEPFILRAQHDSQHSYSRSLADLKYAQQLDPADARSFALEAEILAALGRTAEGSASIQQAARLAPENLEYKLLDARLHAEAGKHDLALTMTKRVAIEKTAAAEVKARAELQLGDLHAMGTAGDFQAAIQHHLLSIQLAKSLVDDKRFEVRRSAKRVLIEAHLAIARDIALGNWNHKDESASKWLANASALAEDFIRRDNGDRELRFLVHRQALAVLAGVKSQTDPADTVQRTVRAAGEVIAEHTDPLYRSQMEWQLGEALFDAALAEQTRSRNDAAMKYAKQALALSERAALTRDANPGRDYFLGRMYFRIGSIYAAAHGNHEQAVAWYNKAAAKFSHPLPAGLAGEAALHGERFVGMGASYWKTGDHDLGLKYTQQGAQLIEAAVDRGLARQGMLAVPYGNLAAMHRELGNESQAKEYAETAVKIEATQDRVKLR